MYTRENTNAGQAPNIVLQYIIVNLSQCCYIVFLNYIFHFHLEYFLIAKLVVLKIR